MPYAYGYDMDLGPGESKTFSSSEILVSLVLVTMQDTHNTDCAPFVLRFPVPENYDHIFQVPIVAIAARGHGLQFRHLQLSKLELPTCLDFTSNENQTIRLKSGA
jgi:hypothetical protein